MFSKLPKLDKVYRFIHEAGKRYKFPRNNKVLLNEFEKQANSYYMYDGMGDLLEREDTINRSNSDKGKNHFNKTLLFWLTFGLTYILIHRQTKREADKLKEDSKKEEDKGKEDNKKEDDDNIVIDEPSANSIVNVLKSYLKIEEANYQKNDVKFKDIIVS